MKWAVLSGEVEDVQDADRIINEYLRALRKQVNQSLVSCNIFRNEMSEELEMGSLCIAIIVYLGFYDLDGQTDGTLDQQLAARFQTPAHMLALL